MLRNIYTIFPDSALSKFINMGLQCNLPYLRYYQRLDSDFSDPTDCENKLKKSYFDKWKLELTAAEIDMDSRLGTHYRNSPFLERYVTQPQNIMEIEKILISDTDTELDHSHSLAIELGRYSDITSLMYMW